MLDFVQVFNMSSPGLDFLANNMSCFFSAFQIIGCLLLYMASSYTFLLAAVSFAGELLFNRYDCLRAVLRGNSRLESS